MKKLPIGIQTFRIIIEEDYVYVDKTKYVYDIITNGRSYFLSRPRRFGKSLLLDTIAEAFSGDKALFKGLWIHDADYSFDKHPVLRLDMSAVATDSPEKLAQSLLSVLKEIAEREGIAIDSALPSDALRSLILKLYDKYSQKVVVLIDEYDKPILDHLTDLDIAEANRAVIRGFYGILKSMDPYLRLTFITGVSKFTKTSLFSELNNLLDITMHKKYASICGIPVEALATHFGEHIAYLSSLDEFKQYRAHHHYDSLHDEILAWYDGYSWDGFTKVLNPFGLLLFFANEKFSSFWYSTGSPKFLIDMIKDNPEVYIQLKDFRMGEWELDTFDVHGIQVAPLLFQTGYLTVKEVVTGMGSASYLLDIPNREVAEALNLHILAILSEKENAFAGTAYRNILEALMRSDLQRILDVMKGFFSSIPYNLHVKQEAYYHSLFFALMNLLGFAIDAEVQMSMGRIDAVLDMKDKVYIFEFKYEDCAPDADAETKRKLFDKALKAGREQIIDRGYADKYAGSGKTVYQAAFAFLGRSDIEMEVL